VSPQTLAVTDPKKIIPEGSHLKRLKHRNEEEEERKGGTSYSIYGDNEKSKQEVYAKWTKFQQEVKMIKFVMQNVMTSHTLWMLLEMPLLKAEVCVPGREFSFICLYVGFLVCMYLIHIGAYIYIYMYTYIHMRYIYINIHVYMYTFIHIHMYTYLYMYVYI
jgi:hypothetical protein